jgi:hypothetical protein
MCVRVWERGLRRLLLGFRKAYFLRKHSGYCGLSENSLFYLKKTWLLPLSYAESETQKISQGAKN